MNQYYYLVSSLPMLNFDMRSPILYMDFLSRCHEQLSIQDIKVIENINIAPPRDTLDSSPTLRQWQIFETTLRNEMVIFRAAKRSKDPSNYIKGEAYRDPVLARSAHWACSQEEPIEAERFLDKLRWERIEELSKEHYFDIDHLITYALKLQILERWDNINSEGGMQVLQGLVAA